MFESVIFLRNERSRSVGISGHHQAETPVIFSGIRTELKALLVKVRPAFVAHLEHAKHLHASLDK